MTRDYVQYGCGFCAPQTWTNFDSSPTLRFERTPIVGRLYTKNAKRFPENVRYGDIVRGLPISPASCQGVYCSHVLEHLALDDFDTALKNSYSYLEPGGVFRFALPDLEQLARTYLDDPDPDAAMRFMQDTYLGTKHRARGLRGLIVGSLGNSAHLWLWDEKSMAKKLAEHGFKDIRRASFGDAEDPRFNDVEEESRFTGCLAMQCRR
jgi:SAM-dependent methyltransferase